MNEQTPKQPKTPLIVDQTSEVLGVTFKPSPQPQSLSNLKKQTPKENPFVVQGLVVENALTVIHGDTGSGKSLITLKMVDDVAQGLPFLGQFKTKKTNSLILDLEMTYDDCIVRARNVVSDKTTDSYLLAEKAFKVTNDDDLTWLQRFIATHNIGLVIFDTFSKIHLADENSNTQITPIMAKLTALAAQWDLAIILLHHVNKSRDATGLSRGRGASAIADNAASYLAISSKKVSTLNGAPTMRMKIMQEKSRRVNAIKDFELAIVYDPATDKTSFEYLGELDQTQNKLNEARKELQSFIQSNPGAPRKDLNKSLIAKGISVRNIRDGIEALIVEDIIVEQRSKNNSKILFIKAPDDPEQDEIVNLDFND